MKKGFTLLETLVAIAILLIAVVGPMSIIGGSLSQISTVRDQTIAVNLAQEGIEIVRQKRDSNMLDKWGGGATNWDFGLDAGNYIIDSTSASPLISCTSCTASQKIVRKNASGWYYQSMSAITEETKFSRIISVTVSGAEGAVVSTVTWSVGGATKKIEVKESIFGINS